MVVVGGEGEEAALDEEDDRVEEILGFCTNFSIRHRPTCVSLSAFGEAKTPATGLARRRAVMTGDSSLLHTVFMLRFKVHVRTYGCLVYTYVALRNDTRSTESLRRGEMNGCIYSILQVISEDNR